MLNHALRGIPTDMVRFHTCYGINEGPRVYDVPFKEFIDIMLEVDAGAYSFEFGNPRHAHEWHLWEQFKLPDGKNVIPGFISHTTIVVEHPELIADHICNFASLVGREGVIAGADCGFSSNASYGRTRRASCGPSSRRWRRAPGWRAHVCGRTDRRPPGPRRLRQAALGVPGRATELAHELRDPRCGEPLLGRRHGDGGDRGPGP